MLRYGHGVRRPREWLSFGWAVEAVAGPHDVGNRECVILGLMGLANTFNLYVRHSWEGRRAMTCFSDLDPQRVGL